MELMVSSSRRDRLADAADMTPPRPLANCFAGEGDVSHSAGNLLLDALNALAMSQ